MNNSENAYWYFTVIAGTIVRNNYGEHKFRGCLLCQCDAVRIDKFHILCECMASNNYREEVLIWKKLISS